MIDVIGTTILGLVGTAIGRYFQDRTAMKKRMMEKRGEELKKANEIFADLSKRMDEYLYRMKEVYNGYNHDVDQEEKNERWEIFQQRHSEWDSTLNLEYSRVLKYFGEKMGRRFMDVISGHFTLLRRELDKLCYKDLKISEMPKDEEGKTRFVMSWERMLDQIRRFNIDMLKLIEEEKVGALMKYSL